MSLSLFLSLSICHQFTACFLLSFYPFIDLLFPLIAVHQAMYLLTMGNRNNQNTPFAIGFKETEDTAGYKLLFGLTQKDNNLKDLINSKEVAVMRDRALAFNSAISAVLPKCKNRVDCIHLARNLKLYCRSENMQNFFTACFANSNDEYMRSWAMVSEKAKHYILEKGNVLM